MNRVQKVKLHYEREDFVIMKNFTKEEIITSAKENKVRFLRLMFTDIDGTVKNVEVPISQLNKALDNEIMFDGSSIDGFCPNRRE